MLVMEGLSHPWLTAHAERVNAGFATLCINDSRFSDSVSRATADKARFDYRLHMWKQSLLGLGADLPRADLIPALGTDN
jgi:hypothetical protein